MQTSNSERGVVAGGREGESGERRADRRGGGRRKGEANAYVGRRRAERQRGGCAVEQEQEEQQQPPRCLSARPSSLIHALGVADCRVRLVGVVLSFVAAIKMAASCSI